MLVLALDTCLGACSVAVADELRSLACASEPMTRGHQEHLAIMARETMRASGAPFSALDRIAVTVGPGSFTGLRVGLAFAKGLALALQRPCVAIGSLEALALSVDMDGLRVAAIDAGRGQLYFQIFQAGQALTAPDGLPIETAAARVLEVAGSAGRHRGGPRRGGVLACPAAAVSPST